MVVVTVVMVVILVIVVAVSIVVFVVAVVGCKNDEKIAYCHLFFIPVFAKTN